MLNYVMTAIETAIMMTIMLLPEARWFFAAGLHIRSYYRPSWTDSKISFILLGITRQHDTKNVKSTKCNNSLFDHHLLPFDVRVHPLLLHVSPGQVEVRVRLVVALQCSFTCTKSLERVKLTVLFPMESLCFKVKYLFIFLLGLGKSGEWECELSLDTRPLLEEL